jgi:hypothetical protein
MMAILQLSALVCEFDVCIVIELHSFGIVIKKRLIFLDELSFLGEAELDRLIKRSGLSTEGLLVLLPLTSAA